MMKKSLKKILSVCLLWVVMMNAGAHELQANRATLVLRDEQHLTLSLLVDYVGVLHRVLAPQQSLEEFVLTHAGMRLPALQTQLLQAQRQLQSTTAVALPSGKPATLTQWLWPDPLTVHKLLQQRAMALVVAPASHTHTVQTEIKSQAIAPEKGDFSAITLQLPAQLQDVLVVSYQPKQVWIKPGNGLLNIEFP